MNNYPTFQDRYGKITEEPQDPPQEEAAIEQPMTSSPWDHVAKDTAWGVSR